MQPSKSLSLLQMEHSASLRMAFMWSGYESGNHQLGMQQHFQLLADLDECQEIWNSMTFEEREAHIVRLEHSYGRFFYAEV
jgi:hypothetical protein